MHWFTGKSRVNVNGAASIASSSWAERVPYTMATAAAAVTSPPPSLLLPPLLLLLFFLLKV